MEGRDGPVEAEAARAAVATLRKAGVEGVVLGCTELLAEAAVRLAAQG
jgi:aspartate/glutamate racemase